MHAHSKRSPSCLRGLQINQTNTPLYPTLFSLLPSPFTTNPISFCLIGPCHRIHRSRPLGASPRTRWMSEPQRTTVLRKPLSEIQQHGKYARDADPFDFFGFFCLDFFAAVTQGPAPAPTGSGQPTIVGDGYRPRRAAPTPADATK